MAPGEMEHIVLPKRLLERAGDGTDGFSGGGKGGRRNDGAYLYCVPQGLSPECG